MPAYKPLLICFILLPLWAVFVALARGDLIIISPMGQVVNNFSKFFLTFFNILGLNSTNPVSMRLYVNTLYIKSTRCRFFS